jgi:hypothetical protein
VVSSFQVSEPGSLNTSPPLCSPACHTPNAAPAESVKIPIRPYCMTSIGAIRTLPPAASMRAAVASASAVAM